MKNIMILVEGQTEEIFVNTILQPYFAQQSIFLNATMVCTRKKSNVRSHRGGISDYDQVKRDLLRLNQSTHFDVITTFFDFYGLPANFPGMNQIPSGNCYQKVEHLEDAFSADINNTKFFPFIMLHEFESMIFCDPLSLSNFFSELKLERLKRITEAYSSPEEINNSAQTSPSKRILNEIKDYQKTLHGPISIKNIGLEKIRNLCPHFSSWMDKLEEVQ